MITFFRAYAYKRACDEMELPDDMMLGYLLGKIQVNNKYF